MRKGDDLTTFIVPKVEKIRSLNLRDPQGPAQACSGKALPLPFLIILRDTNKKSDSVFLLTSVLLFSYFYEMFIKSTDVGKILNLRQGDRYARDISSIILTYSMEQSPS